MASLRLVREITTFSRAVGPVVKNFLASATVSKSPRELPTELTHIVLRCFSRKT